MKRRSDLPPLLPSEIQRAFEEALRTGTTDIEIKLNYRCKEDPPGSGDSTCKDKVDVGTGESKQKKTKSKTAAIKEEKAKVKKVEGLVDKVKAEKKSGRVSKKTASALKQAVEDANKPYDFEGDPNGVGKKFNYRHFMFAVSEAERTPSTFNPMLEGAVDAFDKAMKDSGVSDVSRERTIGNMRSKIDGIKKSIKDEADAKQKRVDTFKQVFDKISESRKDGKSNSKKVVLDGITAARDVAYDAFRVSSMEKKGAEMNGKTRDVTEHIFENGVGGRLSINVPKDPKHEGMHTVKDVFASYMLLPDNARKHIKSINICDERSKNDGMRSEQFGINFVSAGSAGGGNINFFNHPGTDNTNPSRWISTMIHEAAHAEDQEGSTMAYSTSGKQEWADAAWKDDNANGEGRHAITDYARLTQNDVEDFAESVMTFVLEPVKMKWEFPNRYAFMMKHYKDTGGLYAGASSR